MINAINHKNNHALQHPRMHRENNGKKHNVTSHKARYLQQVKTMHLPQGLNRSGRAISNPPLKQIRGTNLRQKISNAASLLTTAKQQQQSNSANQISLIDGAKQAAGIVNTTLTLRNLVKLTQENSNDTQFQIDSNIDSVMQAIGQLGQDYNLENLTSASIDYIINQSGIDAILPKSALDVLDLGLQGSTKASTITGINATTPESGFTTEGILGLAGAAYSIYGLIEDLGERTTAAGVMQGAAAGAYIGSVIPGVGNIIGGTVGAAVGGIAGSIKSGKHIDQTVRDNVRSFLQSQNIIDHDYHLTLADGSKYDIGIDGGARYQNTDGTERAPYQIDTSNPLTHQVVGWLNPVTTAIFGNNKKLKTDFTGYFTNAAISNATDLETARENVLAIYQALKLAPEQILTRLDTFLQSGDIQHDSYFALTNGLTTLLNPEARVPHTINPQALHE